MHIIAANPQHIGIYRFIKLGITERLGEIQDSKREMRQFSAVMSNRCVKYMIAKLFTNERTKE